MTDAPKAPPTIAIIDQPHAPFIYFDGTSNFGVGNGIVNITLVANRFLALSDGGVMPQAVAMAHLRCSVAGAKDLRAALDKAILAATSIEGAPN